MAPMRNPTPQQIRLRVTIYITATTAIPLLILGFIKNDVLSWVFIVLGICVNFVVGFFVFSHYLREYIERRIKIIYKSIHSLKLSKSQKNLARNFDFNSHIIEEVERQVVEWAKEKRMEDFYKEPMDVYRRNLLGNISHELKTPIFNIQGYLHTLLDGAVEDTRVNMKYLQRAAQNLDRLQNIVEDLDTISKIEGGQLEMEPQVFDIHALTKEVIEDLQLKAKEKQIQLRFKEGCDKAFFVYADRSRIRQVLDNLINNSVKYGNSKGYVQVSFYNMHENLLIEISDNGIGIENKHIPRLFERFYRVDKGRSREQGGTGLGLSIVKHIIEAHNQTINVRSSVGVGSTFGFTLEKAEPKD